MCGVILIDVGLGSSHSRVLGGHFLLDIYHIIPLRSDSLR